MKVKPRYKVKYCSYCSRFLPICSFSKNAANSDGRRCYCTECYSKYRKNYRKENVEGIWRLRYNDMRKRVEGNKRNHSGAEGKKLCSRKEFLSWCEKSRGRFEKIHTNWKDSGYERKLAPSIDRIDNDKGYIPSNMRWVTVSENTLKHNKNRKSARLITYAGETKTLSATAREHDINRHTLADRLDRGWSVKDALETPVGKSP